MPLVPLKREHIRDTRHPSADIGTNAESARCGSSLGQQPLKFAGDESQNAPDDSNQPLFGASPQDSPVDEHSRCGPPQGTRLSVAQRQEDRISIIPSVAASARMGLHQFWTKNKGLVLVMAAQFFATMMNVTTRLLEVEGNEGKGLHPIQILFARMSITVALSVLYMWRKETPHFPLGAPEVRGLLIARGLFGFFGVFGLYYSLVYLPLADAVVLTFLAPCLACWACSVFFKEPFSRMEQIAALVSLLGVVLIARPTSLFAMLSAHEGSTVNTDLSSGESKSVTPKDPSTFHQVTPTQRAAAVGVAMLGVVGAAGAYTTIRWIGQRAHPLISVNYFATWCTIVSFFTMIFVPGVDFQFPDGLKEWCYLIFLGACGFVSQYLLAAGLQYEKSSRATNMIYTQMLFALAFDKLVFGSTPGMLSIVGSCLILGSSIYVAVRREAAKSREAEEPCRGNCEEELGLVEHADSGDDDLEDIQLVTIRS